MQNTRASILAMGAILMLVQGCNNSTEPLAITTLGEVNLSIHLSNVGSLSKAATIDLENLYIELNNGVATVRDTVAVSGNSQTIVSNSYTDLVEGSWSVKAESRDVNDIVIHSDSTTFTVVPTNTVDVSLSLTSKYSMLVANFVGIADSVSRCELLVDAALVADSSFEAQSGVGSTLSLSYDYLSTGVEHNIKLDAYGDMWGAEYLLYTGDTTVTVIAGADNNYTINLVWVGPNEVPLGTAAVEITIGPTGTQTVTGDFQSPVIVTDIDGNVYSTVIIGTQTWMAENLKVTRYRDGTEVTHVTDNAAWANLTTEAYCIYSNNAENEVDTYGALYNWYALNDSRNIAPEGWHVPTDDEWKELEMALGMSQEQADQGSSWRGTDEGDKLKSTSGWYNGGNGNNSSGFTALPGGYRYDGTTGDYGNITISGYFWTATESSSGYGWNHTLIYSESRISRGFAFKKSGHSVRCVKD